MTYEEGAESARIGGFRGVVPAGQQSIPAAYSVEASA
jgi:hypothetical protein